MKVYLILSFISFILSTVSYADEVCSLETITDDCRFFTKLKPSSIVELPDGTQIPACFFSSIDVQEEIKFNKEKELAQAELVKIINEQSDEVFHPDFKTWALDNLDIIGFLFTTPYSRNILWPPNNPKKEKQLSPQEFFDYLNDDLKSKIYPHASKLNGIWISDKNKYGFGDTFQFPKARQNQKNAFTKAKSLISGRIERDSSQLSASTFKNSVLTRIREYSLATGGEVDKVACAPGYTAFNSLDSATVGVPPGHFFLGEEGLLRTMAHELTHTFDACRSHSRLIKPSEQRKEKMTQEYLKKWPNSKYLAPEKYLSDGDLQEGEQVLAEQFSIENSPYENVYKCLVSKEGVGLDHNKLSPETISSDQSCVSNQHNEAFCDWFAGLILGDYLSEKSQGRSKEATNRSTRTDKTETNIIKAPEGFQYLIYTLDQACSEKFDTRGPVENSHPPRNKRLNLMLMNPAVAKIFSCIPPEPPPCLLPPTSQKHPIDCNLELLPNISLPIDELLLNVQNIR